MAKLDFEFRFHRSGAARRNDPAQVFRLLVLADFGGRTARGVCDALAGRRVLPVDFESFDGAFARIAPAIDLTFPQQQSAPMRFEPRSLEDFHPDRLYASLPLFVALREMHARLSDTQQFSAAAAELRAGQTGASGAPAAEDDKATLTRLLGRAPVTNSPAERAGDALDGLIRRIVAPHITPAADPMQSQYVASLDQAIGESMRSVLHQPAFQSLERVWRGLAWLMSRLELSEELELCILDVSKAELAADLAAAGNDLDRAELSRLLVAGDKPWSMLVGDYAFANTDDDVLVLAALGSLAGHLGASFVADAAAEVAGCQSFATSADPRDWREASDEQRTRWQRLRTSAAAGWLALAAPRMLLRQPYGPKSDPVERFAFDEFPASRQHENYLWGSAALACAESVARAFAADGWDMAAPDAGVEVDDLPAYTYSEDGERHLQPCAETALSERGADALLSLGIVPLMGSRHRNALRIVRMQSLAEPPQALRGPWQAG